MAYRENIPENTRKKVLERDGYRCSICDSTDNLVIDHCYPYSQGGGNELLNLRTLCQKHNAERNKFMKHYPESLGRRISKEVSRQTTLVNKQMYLLKNELKEREKEVNELESSVEIYKKLAEMEANSSIKSSENATFWLKETTDWVKSNAALIKENNQLKEALCKEQNRGFFERLFYRFI